MNRPQGSETKKLWPTMNEAATYRIRIRGKLGADWSDRVGGMEITHEGGPGERQTVLVGSLADQSSLSGVLNTLHDLRMPVLSVMCLEDDEEGEDADQS